MLQFFSHIVVNIIKVQINIVTMAKTFDARLLLLFMRTIYNYKCLHD